MVASYSIKCLFLALLVKNYVSARSYAKEASINEAQVCIPQGKLQGTTRTTRNNRIVSAFLGIPYAQPPIGNLRFANPVAADGWNGIRNASVDSNKCPQISNSEIVGDENCLYLNVYTPQLSRNATSPLLPVMVFIYGGGFDSGNADSSKYGPEYLLDKDVILVTISYRVGLLGFLSTGDKVASGNWGLKDQVLGLKWVQSNIEYLGGNPDQVTLFGQSAGAASVHLLTMSNLTIGLFHRCITESGSALAAWAYKPSGPYADRAFELGKYVGCSNTSTDSLIECLRTVDVSDMVGSYPEFNHHEWFQTIVWGPTDEPNIKDAVLTDSPRNIIRNGLVHDLPWISGACQDGGLLMTVDVYENETLLDDFVANFDRVLPALLNWNYLPDSGAAWIEPIKSHYFTDLEADKNEIRDNLTVLATDVYFLYPTYDALRQQFSTSVNPQYFYIFDYRGVLSYTYQLTGNTVDYGVTHGDDLVYLFPNSELFSSLNETRSEKDYEMVNIMVELWTSFAIEGKPTTPAMGIYEKWKPYSIGKDNDLRIGNYSKLTLAVEYSYLKERLQFWDDLIANVPL
ncbi:juvenile hormone esterase-like [Neodiprion virginianus]|uniref:juvenile hormone esterase-like n=1 Tax=Neodiprion virginianus TaxID=2961670 RepID=UPI001EE6C0A2|nr:juvenile hormone esterase-like [Neodiprion virginianus]XP_046628118.1 juvenile hormone esterase-like [Neodiprion virginianus]